MGGWGGGANKLGPRVRVIKVNEEVRRVGPQSHRIGVLIRSNTEERPRESTVGRQPPKARKEASLEAKPAGGWLLDFPIQNCGKINVCRSGQAGSPWYFVTAAELTHTACVPLPLPCLFLPSIHASFHLIIHPSSVHPPSSIYPFLLYSFLLPFLLSNLPPSLLLFLHLLCSFIH